MKLLHLLMMLVLAGGAAPVLAQTTQPAPAEGEQTVQTVAKSMAAGDESAPSRLCESCSIKSFDGSSKQWADLTAHTGGGDLVMAKAYLFPGGCIAGDIGAA